MSEEKEKDQPEEVQKEEVHLLQKILDNPWILLLLGLVIPILSYTVWGLVELLTLGKDPLP